MLCNRSAAFVALSCLFALVYGFSIYCGARIMHHRSGRSAPSRDDSLQQKRREFIAVGGSRTTTTTTTSLASTVTLTSTSTFSATSTTTPPGPTVPLFTFTSSTVTTATTSSTATSTTTQTVTQTSTRTSTTRTWTTTTLPATSTVTSTAMSTSTVATTTHHEEGPWECYSWTKWEEELTTNGTDWQGLCERARGDGYAYQSRTAETLPGCGSCSCCRSWADKARPRAVIPNLKYAFVMMAYEKEGVTDITWGALAMAKALHQFSRYPMILLTNTTHFPDGRPLADVFGQFGARILPVYSVELLTHAAWTVEHWNIAFWKLQIWKLTQFDKLIWLDSDAIVYRSVDWLFDRSGMWAQRDAWFCELDAKPVCSGIMLLEPSRADFTGLLRHFEKIGSKITHGDQELIERYFADVKEEPVQLLSPVEASFGQCAGTAKSAYLGPDGEEIPGIWNVPAFVHKSGGWGDTVSNGYNNVCFIHDLRRQRYYVGEKVINACHYNPLAAYWRNMFCRAAKEGKLNIDSVTEFCNDLCYYKGEIAGDFDCPMTVVMLSGPLADDPGAIPNFGKSQGVPAPKAVWTLAPYKFKWGEAHGTQESALTYHNAKLPPPPFTIIADFKSSVNSECQELIGWFGPDGQSVELRLVWGDFFYGEKEEQWVSTKKSELQTGEWQSVVIQREVTGVVQIFIGGTLKAKGRVEPHMPSGLGADPRSSRKKDCYWNGEVQHLSIFNFLVKPDVLAEIAL